MQSDQQQPDRFRPGNIAVTNYSIDWVGGDSAAGEAGRNNSSVIFTISCSASATPPTISAAFDASSVNLGGSRQLQITLTNPTASTMTGVSFAAAALPVNLNGSAPSTTCAGATASSTGGNQSLQPDRRDARRRRQL